MEQNLARHRHNQAKLAVLPFPYATKITLFCSIELQILREKGK